MSVLKWLLKTGPGSPGSTAKVFAKQYNNIKRNHGSANSEEVFSLLFNMRKGSSLATSENLLSSIDSKDLIEFADGDLAIFVFVIMFLETEKFRNNIISTQQTFLLSTEAMFETIVEEAPSASAYTMDSFREKALLFITGFRQNLNLK